MNHRQKLEALRALLVTAISASEQANATLVQALDDDNAAGAKLGGHDRVIDEEGDTVYADRWNERRGYSMVGAAVAAESSLETVRTLLVSLKTINALKVSR